MSDEERPMRAGAMRRPVAPAHLSERSRLLWQKIVPLYVTPARHTLVQTAFEQLDRVDQARELIAKDGLVLAGKGAIPHVHPAARIEKDAVAAVTRLFTVLGVDDGDLQLTWWEAKLHQDHGIDVEAEE